MACIHGLDENSCPTCRISKSTLPNDIKSKLKEQNLKIESPFFNNENRLNQKISRDLTTKSFKLNHSLPIAIPKPVFINEIPYFENKLFLNRLKELDLKREDNFGISKKIPLESPEWQFEEEE
ncbi:MAG: hypothetical protein ACFFFB_24255 [Candidatus Heimdallarchaeota archaeon]